MDFIVYVISLFVVFLGNMLIFYLDNKFTMGDLRELVGEYWVLYFIVILIPAINIVATVILIVIYVIIIFINLSDYWDGEDIIKKIFFIKDDN